jgi:hypothetical protein
MHATTTTMTTEDTQSNITKATSTISPTNATSNVTKVITRTSPQLEVGGLPIPQFQWIQLMALFAVLLVFGNRRRKSMNVTTA